MEPRYPVILRDPSTSTWLHFEQPHRIITATSLDEVLPALREIETQVNQSGWFAAGFISYEASPAFDSALITSQTDHFPLLWFGLYPAPRQTDSLPTRSGPYQLGAWHPSINRKAYTAAIVQIKRQIANGKTYQVNYTFRLRNTFTGSPWSLFLDMLNDQAPGYAAFIDTGTYAICSASPELFFRLDANAVTCRPMKGTLKRGRTLTEDNAQAAWLQASLKNRAENVMVVDMLRNDLGRLAQIGSVRVPELFSVERYPTLLQMTSTITAEISAPFTEILTALFPCASITGAPKVSTTQIIAALEPDPRHIYTGSIGYLAPGRRAQFNVAIRTLLIELQTGQAEYGIGGGIVWDSTPGSEYAEALLKAHVLTKRQPKFSLLETLRWTPAEGFFLLAEHLQRLTDSATYFGFPFERARIEAFLANASRDLPGAPQRLRLLLGQAGNLSYQAFPLAVEAREKPLRVRLAGKPVNSADVFLYHKTTWRAVYETARQNQPDCDDVLLYNERAELTEASLANLVFELHGELVTPPVTCGLLAGTYRAHLLAQGQIREKVVTLSDLPGCAKIFLINSVRGWQKAVLLENKNPG